MSVLAAATAGLRRFLDLLLIALVVVVLVGLILGKLVPLTGRQAMIVGGGSMEPAIGLGAVVIIEQVSPEELRVGDVVSLRAGEKNAIFTHRIVSVIDRPDGRWFGTKGDANAEPDPTIVPASAVIGRSALVIPFAGYLLQILSIPVGVLFLVGLAATLWAAAWLLETLELEGAEGAGGTIVPAPAAVGAVAGGAAPGGAASLPVAVTARFAGANASLAEIRRSASEPLAALRVARQRRGPAVESGRRANRRPR